MTRKPARPSSRDVARLAGVSQAAVSRAFTPDASISDAMRGRVMEAAGQLGYRPNALPRMLLTARSNLVALIMGEITNPFYPEVLAQFLKRLQDAGLHALIFALEPNQIADDLIEEVFRYRVDGVIITSATLSLESARQCSKLDVPVVLFNRHIEDGSVASVCCDNVEAGRQIANLLLDDGHRRPAFISGDPRASTNQDRERGYLGRLRERGVRDVPCFSGENSFQTGRQAVTTLMAGPNRPDAIFCASDAIAFGALDGLRYALGLRVPEDVAVVGFDDVPAAAWDSYRLTTMAQQRGRMVDDAVDALLARIAGGTAATPVRLVSGRLVRRATTREPGAAETERDGPDNLPDGVRSS